MRRTLILIFLAIDVVLVAGVALWAVAPEWIFAPSVVAVEPADGLIGRAGTVEVLFNQRMDRASVEAAFRIEPPVPGTFEWRPEGRGERLIFRPSRPLPLDRQFTVTVETTAANRAGRRLPEPLTITLQTGQTVRVIDVWPSPGADGVPLDTGVMIRFDRPLGPPEATAPISPTITLEPAVAAAGTWLAPDSFALLPAEPLRPGTTYRVLVSPELSDRMALERPYQWSFTTQGVRVAAALPFDGAEEVPTDARVTVTFSHPVRPQAVAPYFQVTDAQTERPVAGELRWEDPEGERGYRTLIFEPAGQLRPASAYRVRLDAPGPTGVAPFEATFVTVPPLAVEAVQPSPGAEGVSVRPTDTLISVQFNRPVVPLVGPARQAQLPVPIQVDPPLPGEGEWLTTSLFVFRPAQFLRPGTQYRVTVRAGLTDTLGLSLESPYTWRFTTLSPAVEAVEPDNAEGLIGATAPITVVFNVPMEPSSTARRLRVTLDELDGPAVEGTVEWPDARHLVFRPAAPLPRGRQVFIAVLAGARGLAGGELRDITVVLRDVAPVPRVLRTRPAEGERRVDTFTTLNIAFTVPMDVNQDPADFITFQPAAETVFANWDYTDPTTLYVWPAGGLRPSTAYTVTVEPGLRSAFGDELTEPYTFTFTTGDLASMVELQGGTFQVSTYATITPTLQVIAYRNVDRVRLRLYRLEAEQFVRLATDWKAWYEYEGETAKLAREWVVDVEAPPNEIGLVKVFLSPGEERLEPGFYFLVADTPERRVEPSRRLIVASPYNLLLKRSPANVLVWATDVATGRPAAGLQVAVYAAVSQGRTELVAQGRTVEDGVFTAPLEAPPAEIWLPFLAVALDESGQPVGAVVDDWNQGASPWMFGFPVDLRPFRHRTVVYTDRPLYRPGQTVFFRGIVREDRDGTYTPLPQRTVTLAVRDPGDEVVYRAELPLSPYGTFAGEIQLPEEAPPGPYAFVVEAPELEGPVEGYFWVAEYRRPTFQVTLTPGAEEVVRGDPLTVTVRAEYFFGGAVSNAPVRWRVTRAPYAFSPPVPGYWSWDDADDERRFFEMGQEGFDELVTEGEGTLDERGHLVIEVPTAPADVKRSLRLTVEADVEDVNGQVVSGRTAVVVHQGAFYVGLRADQFVGQAGRPTSFEVRLVRPDGSPWGEAPVELTFARRTWYSVREQREDGRFYWTTRFTDTVELTQTITADAQGRAQVTVTPQAGGLYTLLARASDPSGNEVRSRAFLWVSSRDYVSWRQADNRALEPVADRPSYRPGDVARILVPTPAEGMIALVTVERGRIYRSRVLVLESNSETIEVPITADMAPVAYVSVVAVKGAGPNTLPDIRLGYVVLNVEPVEQTLDVRVTASPGGAVAPRETVTFTVEVRDAAGRPAQAELSAAMVDKALLALAEPPVPSLIRAFYGERPLSVMTGGTLFVNADAVNQELAAEAKGGGGAGGLFPFAAPPMVREEFPEVAFWRAQLETDEQGRVTFSVPLPDNLTTWVLTVWAVDRETRIGEGRYEVRTLLPFFARLHVPRFLVAGDEALLQAVLHNTTATALEGTLSLEADGVDIVEAPAPGPVAVPAGGRRVLTYRVRAPDAVGGETRATFLLRATAPGYEDALSLSIPVYPVSAPEVVATSGVVGEGEEIVVERIVVPPNVDPARSRLTVEVAPSLAGATQSALDYLRTFPYLCVEQVVSTFLPNIMAYRAIRQAGLDRPDLEAPLQENIGVAVRRLAATQNLDGGWGWWAGDESHPWLTAYALLGLVEANREGTATAEATVERARTYLERWLFRTSDREDVETLNTRAFVLYVLARANAPDVGRTMRLFEQRARLGVEGLAFLGLALAEFEEADAGARAQGVAELLASRAMLSATGIHWEERAPTASTMSSSVRATALAVALLARVDPAHPFLPQAVRWLMAARQAEHWFTTQETAWAVMALTDFMVATRELEADFAYRVTLGDEVVAEGRVTRENVVETQRLELGVEGLGEAVNQLVLARLPSAEGQPARGRLYYAVWLQAFSPAEEISPRVEGISVARRYEQVDPLTLRPTGAPAETPSVGDVVLVRLTVMAPNDLYFFALEDPLPAGLEALDPSLLTTPAAAGDLSLLPAEMADFRSRFWFDGWTRREIRDEKVVLFSTFLPKGTYEYTYLARVTTAGTFTAPPAWAYEMYRPEVYGRSASQRFTVAP